MNIDFDFIWSCISLKRVEENLLVNEKKIKQNKTQQNGQIETFSGDLISK